MLFVSSNCPGVEVFIFAVREAKSDAKVAAALIASTILAGNWNYMHEVHKRKIVPVCPVRGIYKCDLRVGLSKVNTALMSDEKPSNLGSIVVVIDLKMPAIVAIFQEGY